MKKKYLLIVITIVCTFACLFSFAACSNRNDNPPAHTHSYAWTDNGDGTHNGHCSISGCDKPDIANESHVWDADNKCTKCKAEKPSQGEHSHKWSATWEKSVTHHWHNCTADNCDITDNSKKDGYGEHIPGAAATETTAQTCTVCGYVITPPLGHTHSTTLVSANPASCTQNGNIAYYTCTCGKYFSDQSGNTEIGLADTVIGKLNHDWETEWTVDVESTAEHAGSKSHHCSRCDEKTDVTEIPRLTETTYNVIFNANGGKIDGKDTKTVTGTVNQKISKPSNDPVRTDYTFTGWYKDGGTTQAWNFDTDVITGATTLYAGWEQNITEYDVTFVLNYPSASNTTKATENGLITYIPTRTGYIFNGWWYSEGQTSDGSYILSEKFDTSKRVTQSGLTLYAEWVAQRTDDSQLYSPSVSISEDGVFTWNAVDSAQGYKVEVYSGTDKVTEQSLTTTSWTFPNSMTAGYYTVKVRANGNGETTVNSAWTEKYYSYHMLGAAVPSFNNATSILTWNAVKNATAYEVRINNTLKDTITYTTYDLSDLEAGDYSVSVTATRDGWQSAAATNYGISKKRLKTPNVTVTENSSDCTYTLSWQAVAHADTYRIKHHDTYIAVTGTTYTIGNDSAIYDANGIGEFTVCSYDSNADYFISNDSERESVKKFYLVTLNKNDSGAGKVSPSDGHKVGEIVTVSASTNNGYTWLGWYDGNTKLTDNLSYTFTMPSENKTFTAKWALYTLTVNCGEGGTVTRDYGVSSYTVSFDLNGATGTPPQQQIITTTNGLTYPDIPVRGGYLFGGWYENAECSGLPFDFSQGLEADVELYAKWVGYSGTPMIDGVDVDGVAVPESMKENLNYYAFVPLKDNGARLSGISAYSIKAYLLNSSKQIIGNYSSTRYSDTHIISYLFDISLNVKSGELYYIALYQTLSGSMAYPMNIEINYDKPDVGGSLFLPANGSVVSGRNVNLTATTNAGYTWVGWYDGNTKLTDNLSYTFNMPSDSKTLTAKWCKITIECSNSEAGSISSLTGTYKVGDSATVTATTNAGYTWVGWYDGDMKLADNLSYTFTMPNENKTYAAKWCKVTIECSNSKAGSISSLTGTYQVGDIATVTAMTNAGYTWIGWYDGDMKLADNLSYTFTMPNESTTYTAKWQVDENLSIFTFTSTNSTVTITGVNDKTVTTILIPNNVTSINSNAFSGCNNLTSITVDERNSNYASQDGILYNKAKTQIIYVPVAISGAISIPDSITSIGSSTFSGCNNLTSITVDERNSNYASQDGILYNKAKTQIIYVPLAISGAITIPDSITSIGSSTFSGRSELTSITVDERNSNYASQDGILYNKAKTQIIYVPVAISGAISIPDSITDIESNAFYNRSKLASIEIPNSVTKIDISAFYGCSSLTSITIPFVGASKDGTNNTHFGYIFGASSYSNHESYVPWSLKTVIITGGTSINTSAFQNCRMLASITIPNSVTTIRSDVFKNCSGLVSITLPFTGKSATATSASSETLFGYLFGKSSYTGGIATNQYYGSSNYTTYYIPGTLKRITFTGTKILYGAFSNCSSLTNIAIQGDVKNIGDIAFSGCTSLTNITLPDSVTSIGIASFSQCSSLKSIAIPYSVTSIDNEAFEYSGLTSIVIPDNVTSIGSYLFQHCNSLKSVTIGDGVTCINRWTFTYCSLISLTIGSGVVSIEWGAFSCGSNRSPLTNITYNGTKAQWDNITKYSGWENHLGVCTIKCTDETISLS